MDADVAVVGYGPTGMAMTALLARAGYRVVVLERYPGLYKLPRAAIFDDETMRTFALLGIAGEMLPKVRVQRSYQWRNGTGDLLIEHEFAETGRCGWAEWYMMYQPDLEDALDRVCRALPAADIRHQSPVTAISQDAERVTPYVAGGGPVTARYVVACDGGNSFTRRALGIGQHDYGFSEPWLVCDFRLRRDLPLPPAMQVCDSRQPIAIISLGPGHHRFSFMLDSDQDFEAQRQPGRVWPRVARFLGQDDADLVRAATYTFRSVVTRSWRAGRILLAGDAAHEMPPFLGQGMCSGIRDAQNLAFKLDLVLRGRASERLLDTYQAEREPHVRAVIEKGIELGQVQTMRDPVAAAGRDRELLARRAASQLPAKIRFPGLSGGMLSSRPRRTGRAFRAGYRRRRGTAGPLRRCRRHRLDAAGDRAAAPHAGPQRVAGALREAGVRVVALTDGPGPAPGESRLVHDLTGRYRQWFAEHDCGAVAVRPDFYVYGCAGPASAGTLAAELLAELGGTVPVAGPMPRIEPSAVLS